MKKIFLSKIIILVSPFVFAADFGGAQIFEISKNNYSENMFLVLECLSNQDISDSKKTSELTLDHCKSEAIASAQVSLIYNNLPSPIVIDLNKFNSATRNLIVCLGGSRGTKTNEDSAQQTHQDQIAFQDCEKL